MFKAKGMRILVVLAVIIFAIVSFSGCASDSSREASNETTLAETKDNTSNAEGTKEGAKKTIGLVQINFTNPYYIGASEAFEEAAKDLGYELINQSAENSIEKEIEIIENYIEMGVDCIIADPQDAKALVSIFNKAVDAGIPTIALRSPVDTGKKTYNCVIDHYIGFKGVAYAVAESLGGKGEVLLMQGQIGHEASDSRQKGFDEAMANYPGIKVLDQQPCDWDPAKAVAIVENWLTKYEKIDCILSMTDGATPAIVNAVEKAGRMDEIKIAGNDGEMECLEYMVDGKVMAEAFFSSYRDGYHCMVYADAILRGKTVPNTVYLPLVLTCSPELQAKIKANVKDEFLMATPEEAIKMSTNYAQEFKGYYDK